MKFRRFAKKCKKTLTPECDNQKYLSYGLISEIGEVAGAYKKFIRGDYDESELNNRIISEIGDVLWYFTVKLGKDAGENSTSVFDELDGLERRIHVLDYDKVSKLDQISLNINQLLKGISEDYMMILPPSIALLKLCNSSLGDCQTKLIEKLYLRKKNDSIKGDGEGVER